MPSSSRALDLVAPYCDIVERLDLVPPSACVRGVYFRNVESQLDRVGRIGPYRELFGESKHSALGYYPLTDYMLRIAVAGAIVESPERVHQGMFAIACNNAAAFAQSLLGRALFRLLARDPVRLSEQGLAARRQSNTYGHWSLARRGANEIEMIYVDEYQWIESVIAGAAQGTFEGCGIKASVETRLDSRFNGSTIIRW